MRSWDSHVVWEAVAAELRVHRQRGLGPLLTEDTVRFATARVLVDAGEDPRGLRVEWPHPALKGSRVDLVVGGEPPAALVEFKYPREPTEKNAAWTMALGEVLKDFYRLSAYSGAADRLFVYVETSRLRRYMQRSAARYGLNLDTDRVVLRAEDAARLPSTAMGIIGADLAEHHVTGRRVTVIPVDDDLRLEIFKIDQMGSKQDSTAGAAATGNEPTPIPAKSPTTAPGEWATGRPGARREILDSVRAVLTRSGQETFTWRTSSLR